MRASLNEAMRGQTAQRRAFQRYAVNLTVLVQPASEERDEGEGARCRRVAAAFVTDVSLSGLVFVSNRPYPPGSLVEIQISLGVHVHLVRAVVRRNQTLVLPGRRAFQCAAQFVRGDTVARFIPTLARYLYFRFGPNSSHKAR